MSSPKLRVGEPAPAFDLLDVCSGERVALEPGEGRPRLTLLSFFRNAGCAVCNLRLRQMIDRSPSYRAAGLAVVAVFESPAAEVERAMAARRPPFAIAADPAGDLYGRYGVEVSAEKTERTKADPGTAGVVVAAAAAGFPLVHDPAANFHRIPADFLIGGDGRLRAAHYGDLVTDHLPFAEIDRLVALESAGAAIR